MNTINIQMYTLANVSFQHPFTAIVSAPSGGGKSRHVREIINDSAYLIDGLPDVPKILWVHGVWQSLYDEPLKLDISYCESFPSLDQIKYYDLIVFDDCMREYGNDTRLSDLFTKYSHHLSTSVIFITQNLFFRSPVFREASLSTHYLILFKNMRDSMQINALARQLYMKNSDVLMEAYSDATINRYGYIRITLHSNCHPYFRLVTRYTSSEVSHLNRQFSPIIYVEKESIKQAETVPT